MENGNGTVTREEYNDLREQMRRQRRRHWHSIAFGSYIAGWISALVVTGIIYSLSVTF